MFVQCACALYDCELHFNCINCGFGVGELPGKRWKVLFRRHVIGMAIVACSRTEIGPGSAFSRQRLKGSAPQWFLVTDEMYNLGVRTLVSPNCVHFGRLRKKIGQAQLDGCCGQGPFMKS